MKNIISLFLLLNCSLSIADTAIEPTVAWDKKEVRVCFGNETHQSRSWVSREAFDFIEYSNEQKKWIKDIITKEYNLKDTGISFVGFENCTPTLDNIDVILFRFEPAIPEGEGPYNVKGGMATVGEKGDLRTINSHNAEESKEEDKADFPQLNVVILKTGGANEKKVDPASYIQLLALHEFGHTAGLRHQHIIMKSAQRDPNCQNFKTTMKSEPIFESTIFTGDYDFNSVMNYCYLNKLTSESGLQFRARTSESVIKMTDTTLYTTAPAKNIFGKIITDKEDYTVRIGLSDLDKHALRCLYKNDEESKVRSCNISHH